MWAQVVWSTKRTWSHTTMSQEGVGGSMQGVRVLTLHTSCQVPAKSKVKRGRHVGLGVGTRS